MPDPRRHILALLSLSLLIRPGAGCDRDDEEVLEWQLVWQDEFDGPEGQLPDSTKWRFDIGNGWGNIQLEYDTNRPENVSLDGNGKLRIIAREERYENSDYTSGRINTRGLFSHEHGPGHSGDNAISGRYQSPGFLNERYHVYAIEWDTESITWFIDETQYHRVERSGLPGGARWVYNQPFFILLNVAVGGR